MSGSGLALYQPQNKSKSVCNSNEVLALVMVLPTPSPLLILTVVTVGCSAPVVFSCPQKSNAKADPGKSLDIFNTLEHTCTCIIICSNRYISVYIHHDIPVRVYSSHVTRMVHVYRYILSSGAMSCPCMHVRASWPRDPGTVHPGHLLKIPCLKY